MHLKLSLEVRIGLLFLTFPYLSALALDVNSYAKDIVKYLEPLQQSVINSSRPLTSEDHSTKDVALQKRGLLLDGRQLICNDPGYGPCPGSTILAFELMQV
jgi:hypothetical protein